MADIEIVRLLQKLRDRLEALWDCTCEYKVETRCERCRTLDEIDQAMR